MCRKTVLLMVMVGVEVNAGVFPHYSSDVMATLFNGGGWLSYQKMQSAEFTGGEDRLRAQWEISITCFFTYS